MGIADFGILLSQHKAVTAGAIILILSSIEILPLKLNPWSWVISCFRKINGVDVIDKKIDHLSETVANLENRVDEGQAIQARVRILRFGDEIRNNVLHSKDNYNQVLDDITRYNEYCNIHPKFKNEITIITSQIIEESFRKHVADNDFL